MVCSSVMSLERGCWTGCTTEKINMCISISLFACWIASDVIRIIFIFSFAHFLLSSFGGIFVYLSMLYYFHFMGFVYFFQCCFLLCYFLNCFLIFFHFPFYTPLLKITIVYVFPYVYVFPLSQKFLIMQ